MVRAHACSARWSAVACVTSCGASGGGEGAASGAHDSIADASNGLDEARPRWVIAELATQTAMGAQNQALGEANKQVVTITTKAEQESGVAIIFIVVIALIVSPLFGFLAAFGLMVTVYWVVRRVPPTTVVTARISAVKAGLEISVNDLEAHFLAGGNVEAIQIADAAGLTREHQRIAVGRPRRIRAATT